MGPRPRGGGGGGGEQSTLLILDLALSSVLGEILPDPAIARNRLVGISLPSPLLVQFSTLVGVEN